MYKMCACTTICSFFGTSGSDGFSLALIAFVPFLTLGFCNFCLQGFELGIYDPGRSSTSKGVDCNEGLCLRRDECFAALGRCPYTVSYISANTSSSGFLAEDVLHLTSEDQDLGRGKHNVTAYITFGQVVPHSSISDFHSLVRKKAFIGFLLSDAMR